MKKKKKLINKIYNIGVYNLPDEIVEDMFKALSEGYTILSATTLGQGGVQYLLQKEIEL